MRYNPIIDPGIAAGAEHTTVESHEGEEIAGKITTVSLDLSGVIAMLKEFFETILSWFKK